MIIVICSYKNIKFPRENYQTDRPETETLYCFYRSALNFLPLQDSFKLTGTGFNSFKVVLVVETPFSG